LTSLTSLNLSNDEISDLTPLSGLTNLTSLDLRSNNIIDITPLKSLTNLTGLTLASNYIVDISALVENPGIGVSDIVNIRYNQLNCDDVDTQSHISALEDRGVILSHDCL